MSNTIRLSTEQYNALNAKHKGVNRKVKGTKKKVVNGIEFDSTREARRYQDLVLQQEGKQIWDLCRQTKFSIEIHGQHICDWFADFTYYKTGSNEFVCEDCKGWKTDIYKLKKKLVEATYRLKILET